MLYGSEYLRNRLDVKPKKREGSVHHACYRCKIYQVHDERVLLTEPSLRCPHCGRTLTIVPEDKIEEEKKKMNLTVWSTVPRNYRRKEEKPDPPTVPCARCQAFMVSGSRPEYDGEVLCRLCAYAKIKRDTKHDKPQDVIEAATELQRRIREDDVKREAEGTTSTYKKIVIGEIVHDTVAGEYLLGFNVFGLPLAASSTVEGLIDKVMRNRDKIQF